MLPLQQRGGRVHLYSPDLAPSDFWLFAAQRNVSNELIPLVMKKWFRGQPEEF
jgi:hypothetical protein